MLSYEVVSLSPLWLDGGRSRFWVLTETSNSAFPSSDYVVFSSQMITPPAFVFIRVRLRVHSPGNLAFGHHLAKFSLEFFLRETEFFFESFETVRDHGGCFEVKESFSAKTFSFAYVFLWHSQRHVAFGQPFSIFLEKTF